jgi:hypothetical protein
MSSSAAFDALPKGMKQVLFFCIERRAAALCDFWRAKSFTP